MNEWTFLKKQQQKIYICKIILKCEIKTCWKFQPSVSFIFLLLLKMRWPRFHWTPSTQSSLVQHLRYNWIQILESGMWSLTWSDNFNQNAGNYETLYQLMNDYKWLLCLDLDRGQSVTYLVSSNAPPAFFNTFSPVTISRSTVNQQTKHHCIHFIII